MARIAQLISPRQALIGFQPVGEFLNIAVPLVARQRVEVRQRRALLVIAGKIEAVSVNLLRVCGFIARQRAHLRVGFNLLAGGAQITGQTVGHPHTIRVQRQTALLQYGGLRPVALIFQPLRLLRESVVGQAAFNIVNAAPLAGAQ